MSESLLEIRELAKVIQAELIGGGKLHDYEVASLTQPGENYGSILIAVKAKLELPNSVGVFHEKEIVAKVPPRDPKYWQFVQPERTCLTENAIYENLVPALINLQEEAGLAISEFFDGFAHYYGSRTSLGPNLVDHDAVLLLENLRASNYVTGDRLRPLDLAHTQLALKYLAEFHALPLALRLKRPQLFDEQIRPFFQKFDWHAAAPDLKATMKAETLEDIRRATGNNVELIERVRHLSDEFFEFLASPPDRPNGPFASIIHCDYWINNLMFKYDSSGTPLQMKIIDFQTAQYDSVIHDIIAFLFSSVNTSILEANYENMLQMYYNHFISSLHRVGIDTTDSYSYQAFLAEIKRVAYIQVPHAIFMTRFILAGSPDDEEHEKHIQELDNVLKTSSGGASERIYRKLNDILRLAQKFDILY
ncbi:uncharacterized protein [Drosophila tropicalis]|uniref:uncharacterized protein n=1 Tax=Drosophila tropicalis TaxID=46794 RepID=UPI0035AC24C3